LDISHDIERFADRRRALGASDDRRGKNGSGVGLGRGD
jgi:hypothetical protein